MEVHEGAPILYTSQASMLRGVGKEMSQASCFKASTMEAVVEEHKREKVVKLFGVRILGAAEGEEEEVMRKCWSMGCLASCTVASPCAAPGTGGSNQAYVSDSGLDQSLKRGSRRGQERKRGIPWTEEEHRTFLAGLEKLGKGDWRGISREFVTSRTPTQVASHAQKYFLRKNNPGKRKRRSSLFDVVTSDQVGISGSSTVGDDPDLLGVSSSYSSCQPLSSDAPLSDEPSDLELRIALPAPHSLTKLATQGAAGAIRVI
ncbi:hypothetical protein C4D60_Mb07t21860 [Musa balbisiana]|uniref:Uncharacterized protein n=1 Tax=Musa balbisiana TaxID=52838 RepID=A0A4S8JJJ7_MUSBA|nr:hypothetical protein C4D60_Mb07t21860 [Musa balbisiana]